MTAKTKERIEVDTSVQNLVAIACAQYPRKDDEAVKKVLEQVWNLLRDGDQETFDMLFAPVISNLVGNCSRRRIKNKERMAFSAAKSKSGTYSKTGSAGGPEPRPARRGRIILTHNGKPTSMNIHELKKVALEELKLGNGIKVKWWDATVEQIKQRIEMLEKHVSGTQETIAHLRNAMQIIIDTPGATCLRDVENILSHS